MVIKNFILSTICMVVTCLTVECQGAAYPQQLLTKTQEIIQKLPANVPTITNVAQRSSQIASGGAIAYHILNKQPLPFDTNNKEEYLRAIINLVWFFYSLAINKNQAFNEGNFVIKDDGFQFYTFLINYAKMVNPTVTDNPMKDPISMQSDNGYAYSRLSSHFKTLQYNHNDARTLEPSSGYRGKYRHYGIDIRFGEELRYTELPTNDKSHILFGKINEKPDMIFIKIEKNGLYRPSGLIISKEQIKHGTTFITSQAPKLIERQISPELKRTLSPYLEFDDAPQNRKEHYPSDFFNTATSALQNLSPDLRNEYVRLISLLGIKAVYLINQFIETGDRAYFNLLHSFLRPYTDAKCSFAQEGILKQLTDHMQIDTTTQEKLRTIMHTYLADFDHWALRNGREVILTPFDITLPALFYDQNAKTADTAYSIQVQTLSTWQQQLKNSIARQPASPDLINQLIQSTIMAEGFLAATGFTTEFKNTFIILLTAIEDEVTLQKAQSDLLQYLYTLNPKLTTSIIPHIAYRQLIRSLPHVKNEKLLDTMAQVIREKINAGLENKSLTINLLSTLLENVPHKNKLVSAEILNQLASPVTTFGTQLLTIDAFGKRILVHNVHEGLTGNLQPRLQIGVTQRDSQNWHAVIEYGAYADIGSSNPDDPTFPTKVTYQPYGQTEKAKALVGSLFGIKSSSTIDIDKILKAQPVAANQRLRININGYNNVTTAITLGSKHALPPRIIEAFPGVLYWTTGQLAGYSLEQLQKSYPLDLARYILGLPTDYDLNSAVRQYQRLLVEWNPELYPENPDLARAIIGYINWAYKTITEARK